MNRCDPLLPSPSLLSFCQNNFARSENDARKAEIADLDSYAKGENEARIKDIADINARLAKENEERSGG